MSRGFSRSAKSKNKGHVRVKAEGIHWHRESPWCAAAPGTLLIQCRLHKTKKHTVAPIITSSTSSSVSGQHLRPSEGSSAAAHPPHEARSKQMPVPHSGSEPRTAARDSTGSTGHSGVVCKEEEEEEGGLFKGGGGRFIQT